MSEQVFDQEPEEVLEPSIEDQVVEVLESRRPVSEEDDGDLEASASPQETEPSEVEEPHLPEAPTQTDEERDLAEARRIRDILLNNPELYESVVAVERGDGVVIPRQVIEAAQRFQREQAPEQPQEDPADRFYSDPVSYVQSIEQRLARFEQAQAQTAQQRMQHERDQNTELLASTGAAWRTRHAELTDEQEAQVIQTIAETNLIARNLRRNGGNKAQAVEDALEAAWRMEFPELAQQRQTDQIVREANRKRRAGAAAASPRSNRAPVEDAPPRNSAERKQRMADDIRELLQANQ